MFGETSYVWTFHPCPGGAVPRPGDARQPPVDAAVLPGVRRGAKREARVRPCGNGVLYSGAPFNGALYIMVYYIMAHHLMVLYI